MTKCTIIKTSLVACLLAMLGSTGWAQTNPNHLPHTVARCRVIVDNDFGGDPDGLFQMAQLLLSPSVKIVGIIGSQNYPKGFYGQPGDSKFACKTILELLKIMPPATSIPVVEGASVSMVDTLHPVASERASFIVREAMRDDKLPLYILCGAGLSTVASAYLQEPKIAERMKLIWIGGAEYPGMGISTPGNKHPEYNLGIDIKAAQVVFNCSAIPLWQIPRNTYRQALFSYAELKTRIGTGKGVGSYLLAQLDTLLEKAHGQLGETYVLGDSPLVLLSALQTSWETDPASSSYQQVTRPKIDDKGKYLFTENWSKIRVYTSIDTRLMFEDFVAKLQLWTSK